MGGDNSTAAANGGGTNTTGYVVAIVILSLALGIVLIALLISYVRKRIVRQSTWTPSSTISYPLVRVAPQTDSPLPPATESGQAPMQPAGAQPPAPPPRRGDPNYYYDGGDEENHYRSVRLAASQLRAPAATVLAAGTPQEEIYARPPSTKGATMLLSRQSTVDSDIHAADVADDTLSSIYSRPVLMSNDEADNFKRITFGCHFQQYPRHWLNFIAPIGKGQFAVVFLVRSTEGGTCAEYNMAAKALKPTATDTEQADFLREAMILSKLNHENTVRLLGVCMNGKPWLALLDYCEYGDLREFLRICTTRPNIEPYFAERCRWAYQIACGMNYVSSRRIVHRDLSARNCLVAKSSQIKVSDFGLSINLEENETQRIVEPHGKLPLYWMAIEAIMKSQYSAASDVWSFGVLLWEIMTDGIVAPYGNMPARDVCDFLISGRRLHRPRDCPDTLYGIMQQCWDPETPVRPSFDELQLYLADLLKSAEISEPVKRDLGALLVSDLSRAMS